MRKLFLILLLTLPALTVLFAQDAKILVAGSGNRQISIIDKATGKVEWTHQLEPGEECNTVSLTKHGEILYSYKKGARLITTDQRVVWDYKAPENTELQSATLLRNGGYLLGICGTPARFIELDKSGKVRNTVTLDLDITKAHSQFRQVFQLKNGNYLIPVMGKQKIIEVNRKGSIVAEHDTPGRGAFSSLELKNGNLILPCGDGHYYLTLDRKTGKEISRVNQTDIEGVRLLFVAQILQLKNGNLLICNWHGHNKDFTIDEPQLIEVTPSGKVVWSLNDKENIGKISAAFYIENPRNLNY